MRRLRILLWVLVAIAAPAAGALYLFTPAPANTGGTVQLRAGAPLTQPFALTRHDGQRVTRTDFAGRPTAWFFGFTHCPEVCPTTLFQMTQHLAALGADADRLNVVFVSVDPERDTPELLREYLGSFDRRIVALTGSEEEVRRAAEGFFVRYARRPIEGGYTVDHSTAVLLTDRDGRLISTLDYHEPPESQLEKLRRLAREG